MNDLAYSGVNTTVRILEDQLLGQSEMDSLLNASSLTQALELLQKSHYHVSVSELSENKQFDAMLTAELKAQYDTLYALMPVPELLDLFSIRYSYHNLKVLLKEKFSGKDLKALLIPIGRYSLETLKQLVETMDSDSVPDIMIEAVRESFSEFENFGRLETADIFMDTYYFRHLRYLEQVIAIPRVHEMVNMMIDLENISTLIRASQQHQSRSFLQTVLSNVGTVEKTKLIDTVQEQGWESLLSLFDSASYKDDLATIVTQEPVHVLKIELLKDEWLFQQLRDATFEAFGPFPALAYIHACEMEVKNLRLLLVGIDNDFSTEQLKERMRPVYGS